jgi:DNA-binding transcriptional MerR regulator
LSTHTIGEVLNRLKDDFDDITISKIRFLEAEGLINPDRTESGYRKFTDADVERLRYVLRAPRAR